MTRPLHGPLNPTPVDHSTDTYDTIEWLVKNVPESNSKVGILGISYDGFLPLMALVNATQHCKVAVPMNPIMGRLEGRRLVSNGTFANKTCPIFTSKKGRGQTKRFGGKARSTTTTRT